MVKPSINYKPPTHTGLQILYQDDALLVLDKPSGLLSVPGRGEDKQDSLASRVQDKFPDACIVHRLDMETSGIMLMAHGKEVQAVMSKKFENRQIHKRYTAMVDGIMDHSNGKIDAPLITDWPNRPRQIVDHEAGKSSLTYYNVLNYDSDLGVTRVELEPVTGRSHQLRVHMQSIGHAILGDRLYADSHTQQKATRLLLHATSIRFEHPVSMETISIESMVPF